MSALVYGGHEAKTYYIVESTYGQTPTTLSMTGLATAEFVEPNLNSGLIKVRGTGSRDLQTLRKGLRQVGLKISYSLPSVVQIDFLLNVQTLDSLSIVLIYEKPAELSELDFKSVFLTSDKTNLNKLETLPQTQINKVKSIFKQVLGLYRKRIAGKKQAFLTKKEFVAILDSVDMCKLAKMLYILGFLTQTKVYLFWEQNQQ